jgi:regulator of cell morphogenesis and NO signaling
MFLTGFEISDDSLVTDIVIADYRTSAVFRKYAIDYCCGGRLPLNIVCDMRGLDIMSIKQELSAAVRTIQLPGSTNFDKWSIDFLVDYIINVHHAYLFDNFPDIIDTVKRFVDGHKLKHPYLADIADCVMSMRDTLLPHLLEEENIIFPYIRQIAHAYENHEPYAALLVRTLRKPVENRMHNEHTHIAKPLHQLRQLTNNYQPAANACLSHKVAFAKLKEFDNDLAQHIHLEGNILFPKAVAMEKEMLAS